MRTSAAVLVAIVSLASHMSAQTVAARSVSLEQPRPAVRTAPPEPLFSVRGFGLVTAQQFAAPTTFDAIFGSSNGTFFGGGAQVVHRSGLFAEFGASRFRKTGERAFLSDGESFRLGIPLTATVTPIEVTGGYQFHFPQLPRIVPYAGGGAGSYRYEETSPGSDDVDIRHAGYLVVGGVEVRATRWVGFTVDAHYTHIPGILGTGGISQEADEDDLGGTAVRFRVIVGR